MGRDRYLYEGKFSGWDLRRFTRWLSEVEDTRVYRRILAVRLVAEGRSVREAIEVTGVPRYSMYQYMRRYLSERKLESFFDLKRKGRPVVEDGMKCVERLLEYTPYEYGYRYNVWTVPLLVKHLQEHEKVQVSIWTLYRRLHEAGYSCKRPKYFYSEKDPFRAQKRGQL